MSLTAEDIRAVEARHPDVFHGRRLKRLMPVFALAAVVAYALYVWVFFDINRVIRDANWDVAGNYMADWIAFEIRPDLEFRDGYLEIVYPRYSTLGSNPNPEWITSRRDMVTIVEEVSAESVDVSQDTAQTTGFMANAPLVSEDTAVTASPFAPSGGFMASGAPLGGSANEDSEPEVLSRTEEQIVQSQVLVGDVTLDVTPYQVVLIRGDESYTFTSIDGERLEIDRTELPEWLFQRNEGGKVIARLGFAGRVEIEPDEVKVRARFLGWENFLFDTNSPFWGRSLGEVFGLMFSGDELKPGTSNAALAWNNFVNNAEWQHGDVWIKLLQTIVMAFLGTLFATLIALPLAFAAARNITRSRIVNQVLKRFFDFLRSVDMLLWALVFTRTFGPGPLAGISAIFVTDAGTFGKLYSEALENIDDKQREGVKSVGASPIEVQRYGVMPQVLPVFISQSLYFWESNTRSATIIGAVGAGGIGLKLWEAMRTNQDWENVAYMVILILIVVFIFDNISTALRKRLIG